MKIYADPIKHDKNAFPELPKKTLLFILKYKKIKSDKIKTKNKKEKCFVKNNNDIIQKIIVDAYKPFTPSIKFEALKNKNIQNNVKKIP